MMERIKSLALWAEKKNFPAIFISIGLCLVLFWIGAQKITPTEATGIAPLIGNSPLVSWTQAILGIQGSSIAIGIYEYIAAVGIIIGFFKPRVGLIATIMTMIMFFVTFTFFISTPGTVTEADGLYGPTGTGGFLLKDVTLFGSALYLFTFFGRQTQRKN
ncbi:DUF417 family protein [Chitinophaga agrisoli]|uniref:DUF417 family protein n=1 Tax=Chitinophaga agrisoli TaxID=2607653 RepID=A0A5B2VWC2_9BACT|nr:DUF417 family protein [Chitinophaga agrisoli]KAA2242940.1 DUF417 family protein [Chitinophaga agrisoli]